MSTSGADAMAESSGADAMAESEGERREKEREREGPVTLSKAEGRAV